MFIEGTAKGYVDVIKGVHRKTLAVGDKSMLIEFTLDEGAVLPLHSHPHEQIGYLLSGELQFTIGEEEHIAKTGDSWAIPGDVKHAVRVIKNAVVVEVFAPIREDYLD